MADRMAGQIWIGGSITRRTAEQLCRALSEESASLQWGEECFRPKTPEDLAAACCEWEGTQVLSLCDDEACYGQFEQLESFLIAKGISFRRSSEGKYEFEAEIVEFRPGIGCIRTVRDQQGQPLVRLAIAREAEAALQDSTNLLRQRKFDEARKRIQDALERCQNELPPPVRPLPPLIVRSRNSTPRGKGHEHGRRGTVARYRGG